MDCQHTIHPLDLHSSHQSHAGRVQRARSRGARDAHAALPRSLHSQLFPPPSCRTVHLHLRLYTLHLLHVFWVPSTNDEEVACWINRVPWMCKSTASVAGRRERCKCRPSIFRGVSLDGVESSHLEVGHPARHIEVVGQH